MFPLSTFAYAISRMQPPGRRRTGWVTIKAGEGFMTYRAPDDSISSGGPWTGGIMTSEVSERRKNPRIDARLALQVEKKLKGGVERPATTESLNLSSSGLYCHVRGFVAPMTKVGLTLLLPSFGRAGKKTQVINCEAIVVRCEEDGTEPQSYELACCFTDVRKEDRQLIEEYIGWRLMRDLIDERLSRP